MDSSRFQQAKVIWVLPDKTFHSSNNNSNIKTLLQHKETQDQVEVLAVGLVDQVKLKDLYQELVELLDFQVQVALISNQVVQFKGGKEACDKKEIQII